MSLYYTGIDKKTPLPVPAKEHPTPAYSVMDEPSLFDAGGENNPWDVSIEILKNVIQTLHYAKKTLKAYSLWAEKLRYFAKDKAPDALTIEDIKIFLTFLAV